MTEESKRRMAEQVRKAQKEKIINLLPVETLARLQTMKNKIEKLEVK